MSVEREERAFGCGLHCCWFSSSSSSSSDDDDDEKDEEGGIQSRTAAAFIARIRARI